MVTDRAHTTCPLGRARGHQAALGRIPPVSEGPPAPLSPASEQQSPGRGQEVKLDYESVSLLCF